MVHLAFFHKKREAKMLTITEAPATTAYVLKITAAELFMKRVEVSDGIL